MEESDINRLAADIREVDGSHELGAGAIAEALIGKGWIHSSSIPVAEVVPEKPLSLADFSVGEPVEVFLPSRGDWTGGRVVEIGQLASTIHVAHEYGSTTVASTHRIRKVA